jgi:hypothetical protein
MSEVRGQMIDAEEVGCYLVFVIGALAALGGGGFCERSQPVPIANNQ